MKSKLTGLISLFMLSMIPLFAQQGIEHIDTSELTSLPAVIIFKKDSLPDFQSAKDFYRLFFPVQDKDDLRVIREQKDELGYRHIFYQQYYDQVKVLNGIFVLHVHQGKITSANGNYIPIGELLTAPKISTSAAIQSALSDISASQYKWEIPEEEQLLSQIAGKDSSYYPRAELVVSFLDSQPRLSYSFVVYAHQPLARYQVVVDAETGKMLSKKNTIRSTNSPGTAVTRYSGSQNIITDSYTGGFRLRETRGPGNVNLHTYNMHGLSSYSPVVDFSDNNNNWTSSEHNNANNDWVGLDAHWGQEKYFDYFQQVRGRNSFNNSGAAMLGFVNADLTLLLGLSNSDNAFWDGLRVTYGKGTSHDAYTTLDIVAHEWAHALSDYTIPGGGFLYEKESGAIEEGLSDIWAACVEQWAAPTKSTWIIGEDNTTLGIRSMSNPNTLNNPDTYNGTYYQSTSGCTPTSANDYCGVHKNSTIASHWFYRVAMGGSGTNDIGQPFDITGIGITKAADIVYRAQSMGYIGTLSTFAQLRSAMIQSATELYGATSCETKVVTNAWHAVGVGSAYTQGVTITGPAYFCTSQSYSVSLPTGVTVVSWSASGSFSISGSTTGTSVTVNKVSNGYGTLRVTLNYGCTQTVLTKSVYAGLPVFPSYWTIPEKLNQCDEGIIIFTLPPGQSILSADGSNGSVTAPLVLAGSANMFTVPADVYQIILTITNDCGTVTVSKLILKMSCFGGFITYPNPANTQLTIENNVPAKDHSIGNKTVNHPTAEFRLFNKNGFLIKTFKLSGDKITIQTSDLRNGIYYLQRIMNQEKVTRQIIIQH